jgi:tRNA pseudouridine32 synthase/23S rRNA pseudouridine746 synthase
MDTANIMARLLHRDASMLVLDKPAGLPVHRERGAAPCETLTDWLDDLRFGLPRRPELAHRLDRETSGCLVLGRHPRALARLSSLFAAGQVEKLYWAVVEGVPATPAGTIDLPLSEERGYGSARRMRPDPDGKPAVTHWRVLASSGGRTWLALEPVTGRTHQLRVHCAASGWPIVGDERYGDGRGPLLLHARRVAVPFHPKKVAVTVEAPPPPALAAAIAHVAYDGLACPER